MSDAFVRIWGSFLENFWYLIVFGYGAIVGSFLNVLIYRMPLGMSVSKPASHCPNCNHYLGFWDNIPLFAFLALGGRCRYCRVPISWRYFGVELLTACLWTALFHHVAGHDPISWLDFLAQALFIAVLVAVIFIDLDHFIIPDELNWVGIALGVARDVLCLAFAWRMGGYVLAQASDHYAYFRWLPHAIPGALLYGGILYVVSFVAFLVYARGEQESLAGAARRFFTFEELEEDETDVAAETAQETALIGTVTSVTLPELSEEEGEGEAVRLRFSPAFLTLASALVLLPVMGAWAVLVFVLPFAAFLVLTRRQGEVSGGAAARFFHSNDLGGPAPSVPAAPPMVADDDLPLLPGDERLKQPSASGTGGAAAVAPPAARVPSAPSSDALSAEDADQFAIEAESGKHGGMGLGDVKLALAIGAILGPGPALVSLFFATAGGAFTGVLLARLNGRGLRLAIPFGPFMAFGAIVMMLYGSDLLNWYFGLFTPPRH